MVCGIRLGDSHENDRRLRPIVSINLNKSKYTVSTSTDEDGCLLITLS